MVESAADILEANRGALSRLLGMVRPLIGERP
jgi:hypothetical protein